ncbi:hypothetical protein AZI86_05255 [Bdellovibrio bacteriovorus]|uniref:HTH cro/C1-type domain-containing protein n=1 Tax=Bdellovibrio bacteriovorus TaxID=959 RepID=A0A150WQ48_BDEBC|nr:XRE family transcriptional regulator [Bdellovibrio bacteriovorus]KYG66454.1 hypothetical protein AZI86_05255 [Bdellovibrio bacteriovorus]
MDMLEKKLNTKAVSERMIHKGLSQTDLADKLQVSKATISSWLKPEKFPRPRHLLQLGELLSLKYEELILESQAQSPVVAFRKSGNYKITPEHMEKFYYVGRLLNKLVQFLPFDTLSSPTTLKDPKLDYEYIQKAASSVRQIINPKTHVIDFPDLIRFFNELHAVLIPVLWGTKHYKNATHLYLPESSTTWIFINLDTKVFDFKFWLAHELGHAKAPQLLGEEGEEFADNFAGALLFPRESAEAAYKELSKVGNADRLKIIGKFATEYLVSPITIYLQIEEFAKANDLPSLELEKQIYGFTTNFNKSYKLISEILLNVEKPSVEQYCKVASEAFKTPFFSCLSEYLKASEDSPKFVANLLDISIEDAQELFRCLVKNG